MSDRKDLLKKMHDLALSEMPEGASHDEDSCDFCKADKASLDHPRGENIVETFTKEQHEQALAEALKPLQDEIASLKAARADDEVAKAVEAAKAEAAEELSKVQADLDAAQIEKNAAIDAAEAAKAEFESFKFELVQIEEAEKAARDAEARKAERVEKVKEVAKFDDEQIAAKADRWAAMNDDDFASLVEDYKAVAEKAAAASTAPVAPAPAESAMSTVAPETAGLDGTSALSFIGEARAVGYMPGSKF